MNCSDNKLIFEQYVQCIVEQLDPRALQPGDQFADMDGNVWQVDAPLGSPNNSGASLDTADPVSGAGGAPQPVSVDTDMQIRKAGGSDAPVYRRVLVPNPTDPSQPPTVPDWIDPYSYKSKPDIATSTKDTAAAATAAKKAGEKDNTAGWAKAGQAVTGQMAAGAGGKDWLTRGALGLAGKGIKAIGQKAPERGAGAVGYV